jgi:dienelactone hydrolase
MLHMAQRLRGQDLAVARATNLVCGGLRAAGSGNFGGNLSGRRVRWARLMSLERYQCQSLRFPGPPGNKSMTHDVYSLELSDAPAVIVLHELFGLSPAAIQLGDYLADSFSVYLPSLFGRPARGGLANAARAICVRREFSFFVTGKTSPIAAWVRGLAGFAAERASGRPVGLIGMCLTGGVVFAAIADSQVGVGVASQPSLPFPWLGPFTPVRTRQDMGTSPGDLGEAVSSRTPLMMLRYRQDWMCPAERAAAAIEAFGGVDDFRADPEDSHVSRADGEQITLIDIDGGRHSVLGVDLNPRARDLVKEYLQTHLG